MNVFHLVSKDSIVFVKSLFGFKMFADNHDLTSFTDLLLKICTSPIVLAEVYCTNYNDICHLVNQEEYGTPYRFLRHAKLPVAICCPDMT